MIKKELKGFNINIDDIETINFENGMLQQIARKCAEEYDLKRLELVLNGNIITAKDKFTGINSYMGMRVSLEPLEKDISFIIRPTNELTYNELQQENKQLKDNWNKLKDYIVKEYYMYLPLEVSTRPITILIDKMYELEGSDSNVKK